MAYLTDNKAARTHSEGFLHEASEGNLAGTFKIRLPAWHGDDVGQPQLKHKECVSTDVRRTPMTSTNGKLRPTDGSWLAGFDAALDVVDQRIDREEIVRGRTISHRTVDPEPGDSIAGTSAFYPGHQAGWDTRALRRALPPQVQAATYDARLVAARLLRRAADRLDRLDLLRWAMGAGDDRAGSAARGAGCSPAAGPTSLSPWSEGPARCSLSSRDSLGDALSPGEGALRGRSNPQGYRH